MMIYEAKLRQKCPRWVRCFGLDDEGEVYLHHRCLGIGDKAIMHALYDNISMMSNGSGTFIPYSWIRPQLEPEDASQMDSIVERMRNSREVSQ